MQKDWDKNMIKTIHVKHEDGYIINTSDNEVIICITYGVLQKIILKDDFNGFVNLEYNEDLDVWIIFQIVS